MPSSAGRRRSWWPRRGGTLANPPWLATCRRRVTEVAGAALHSRVASSSVSGLAQVRALTEAASPCHAGAQV